MNNIKLHSWTMESGDSIFKKTILTTTKDIKVASNKLKILFPKNYIFIKLKYNGLVER